MPDDNSYLRTLPDASTRLGTGRPDFTVEREVAAYTLLEQHGIAAPRLIAADIDGTRCGAPALLMTRLDGQRPGATAAELPSFVR